MRHLRYWTPLAVGSRLVLTPLVGTALVLLFVYAYPDSAVGPTWALTAVGAYVLSAWFVLAVLSAEPDGQRASRVAATGGWRRAWRSQLWLVCAITAGLTVLFLVFPVLTDAFDRPVRLGDLLGAAEAHVACAVLGGVVGVLLAPPRVRRRAASIAGVLLTLVGTFALADVIGPLAGPGSVSTALSDAAAGHVTLALQAAVAVSLAAAAALLVLAHRLEGRAAL